MLSEFFTYLLIDASYNQTISILQKKKEAPIKHSQTNTEEKFLELLFLFE
jgi:hypothetical protein